MYCPNCGNPLAEDARFCPNCGASMTPAESAPVAQENPNAVPPFEPTSVYGSPDNSAPEKPKKKHKGLIIAVVAVVVVLAIAAALYFFVFRGEDEKNETTAETAAEKTVTQLQEVFENCENLKNLGENLQTIAASEQLTVRLGVETSEFYSGDEAINMTFHYDGKNAQLGGVIDLNGVALEYYADEEQLMIRCADFDDSYFAVPLDNFGEAFASSALATLIGVEDTDMLKDLGIHLFAQIDPDDFIEQNPEIAEFVESLEFVEVEKTIPNAEDMTVYEITLEARDVADLYSGVLSYFSSELIGDVLPEDEIFGEVDDDDKLTVQIGVNEDGYPAALHLFADDEEGGSFTVILCGEDNLFEEIEIYENDEQIYTLSLEKTKHGFRLSGGEDKRMPLLVCNDDDCELIIYDEDGKELLTIVYGTADDGVSLETVLTQDSDYGDIGVISTDIRITAELVPFEGVEEPNGEVVEIFNLSEAELQELAQRLMIFLYGGYSFAE